MSVPPSQKDSPLCTHQGQSPSGAHTPCDVIWIQRRDFIHTAVGTCSVGWVLEATLLFFFFSFPSYLFSCTHVTFGRMLLMLWINPEALGRERNLDHSSSQDSTRCESCLATEHEILSAGRWFIIFLLQLGGNGKIETQRKGNGCRSISPLPCANKFLYTFQSLIIFVSATACYWMEVRGNGPCWCCHLHECPKSVPCSFQGHSHNLTI